MRPVVLSGVLVAVLAALLPASGSAQEGSKGTAGASLGSVTLTRKVLADGQPLAAGTYQVRLSADEPSAVVGQSPARYVEFVMGGKVVGREVAMVVSSADMAAAPKSGKPATNAAAVAVLRGDDYLRVWINRGGTNYLIYLPPA